jgi:hypothetical protein
MTPAGWLMSGLAVAASLLATDGITEERSGVGQTGNTAASAQQSEARVAERRRQASRQPRERVRLTFPPAKR